MSDEASSRPGAAPPEGIERYLVRYAPSGRIGWFGYLGQAEWARGSEVVVETALGRWLGRVLRREAASEPHAGGWEPSGEVVAAATEADREAAEAARRRADRLWMAVLSGAVPLPRDGQMIDVEVSICQRIGVCRWLGKTHAELGPVAVRLAERAGLQRVQMLAEGTGRTPMAAEDERTPQPAVSAEPWLQLAERLQEPGGAIGKAHRERLGLVGLYEQKLRTPAAPAPASGGGRRFMVRIRIAGGRMSGAQLRAAGALALEYGDGTLRLTTRQALQLHRIPKANLDALLERLSQVLLTTAGTCGNTARNVTCCPLVAETPVGREVERLAADLSRQLTPRRPYYELLFREQADAARWQEVMQSVSEPIYGADYLPHKWKAAVVTDRHNCVAALASDVAVVLRTQGGGAPRGQVTLCAGGSLAYRPGQIGSFPALAEPVADLPLGAAVAGVEAMVRLFQRLASGGSRHQRRWKYVVRRLGPEGVLEALAAQAPEIAWRPPLPLAGIPEPRHRGWMRQGDGRWTLGLPVAGGRLDFGSGVIPWFELLDQLPGAVRIAADHTVLLPNLDDRQRASVERRVARAMAGQDHHAVACPALPTCPLAVAPAESVLAEVAGALERLCRSHGIRPLELAISGCGNGCSRPLMSEVGIVAERPEQFAVFVGGDGQQLAHRIGVLRHPAELERLVGPLVARFAEQTEAGAAWNRWVRGQPEAAHR